MHTDEYVNMNANNNNEARRFRCGMREYDTKLVVEGRGGGNKHKFNLENYKQNAKRLTGTPHTRVFVVFAPFKRQ